MRNRKHVYRCQKCKEVCLSFVKLTVVALHGASPGRPKAHCGGILTYEGPTTVAGQAPRKEPGSEADQ